MELRIADTFTSSLARLVGEEQKLVKTTAFDLQVNPSNPGNQFHKLDRAKDPNFWSVRVSSDIRLIVHRTDSSLLLCYAAHHDDAYRWAERRKLETHPKTGAAQIVEIREVVRDVEVLNYVQLELPIPVDEPVSIDAPKVPKPALFKSLTADVLLSYGVPLEWISETQSVDEDGLFELAEHLPAEAAEALLELAVGGTPKPVSVQPVHADPFQHPDALRRFRTVANIEELTEALDYPWEKWAIFLHPAQKELVERELGGPARVSGSAGTGKTVVALHRAVFLAKSNPDAKVLLTTFSPVLANQLRTKIRRLLAGDPRIGERLEVADLNEVGCRLFESSHGKAKLATQDDISHYLSEAATTIDGHKFNSRFLTTEWLEIVDAWNLTTWEEYREVRRLGRKTRLPEAQRAVLWAIFEQTISAVKERGLMTRANMFTELAISVKNRRNPPFDFVVVDEAQDVSIPQLRFLAALGGDRPNSLFFAGDLGQRIFQYPFSWLSLGVDVRGRSRSLKINYRTSHQIRMQADRLLGPTVADIDGNEQDRRGTVSVFNGPSPSIHVAKSEADESEFVGGWLKKIAADVQPHEICLIVRSDSEIPRCLSAVKSAGLSSRVLTESVEPAPGHVSICTMHLAKGLEFRAVAIMACDDEIIPLQERIETVVDDTDLDEVYNTERHLLYVACTRARDFLLVTSSGQPSEFLEDLQPGR